MADIEEIEFLKRHPQPGGRPESPCRVGEVRLDRPELPPSNLHWSKLTVNGKSPAPRWGHSACVIGSQLHVFGGSGVQLFNDYFIYDSIENAWSTPALAGQVPGARFGHTTTVVGNKIYLFGGHGTNSKPYSDLYVMELENFSWTKYTSDKTWPESRAGHTLTFVSEKNLIIGFGGHNNKQKYYNGVFILEKVTADKNVVWKTPKINATPPTPRSSHTATPVGDRLFVFGGFDGRRYYNDLHILDLEEFTWRSPVVRGKIPAPRSGHTATLFGTKLFIIGGCSSDSTFLNDVHMLDTETCTWVYLAIKGTVFPPRFKHTSSLLKTGLHVFGGTGSGTLFNDVTLLENLTADDLSGSGVSSSRDLRVGIGGQPKTSPDTSESAPAAVRAMNDQQVEALRLALQSEKEARERLETKLAAKEGDYLVSLETTKRLEGDLNKLESTLRAEQEKRAKLDRSVKNEKEKRQKASAAKEALEQTIESQKNALDALEARFRALEASLNKEQTVRIEAEAEISRLRQKDAAASESLERTKRQLESMRKDAVAPIAGPDMSKMSTVELDAYEQEQMRIFSQIARLKSEQTARLEQERNKLRADKLVLEEQKSQAQKALQEARRENELLKGRLYATESSLAKVNQKHNSLQHSVEQAEKNSKDLQRRGTILSSNLGEYSLAELDELEEYLHKSLKRIATAKQERFSVQIEKLKREKEQLQEQRQCVVCQDKDIRTVIIPCGHQTCCRECAAALTKCPMCRGDIGHIVHTF